MRGQHFKSLHDEEEREGDDEKKILSVNHCSLNQQV